MTFSRYGLSCLELVLDFVSCRWLRWWVDGWVDGWMSTPKAGWA